MASGDTKLSICSDALIMLGAAPLLSEGTDSAQITDRLYDDIRDSTLGMHPWTFSFKRPSFPGRLPLLSTSSYTNTSCQVIG